MSKFPLPPSPDPDAEPAERRAPRGAIGSLRWFRSLLGRPLKLERRGADLHISRIERRRTPDAIRAAELDQLRDELRTRLLEHDHEHHAAVLRHLVFVHDVLGRQGWPGVGAMDARVLGKALAQAQMLAGREGSAGLSTLVEQLRLLQVAAGLREERLGRAPAAAAVEAAMTPPREHVE